MLQLAEGATDAPQVFVCEKLVGFAPVTVMLEIVSVEPPVFVRTMICVAFCPTETAPKFSEVGLKPTAGAVPVPLNGTCCGDAGALSANTSTADSAPTIDGVNVALTVHDPLAASVAPHVLDEIAKSSAFVPEIVMLEILSVAVPVFVSVVVKATEVVFTA
jgi:hypothetical protein